MSKYEFAIEDCDIQNKETLELFREKHSEWLYLMNDDDHAVTKQLQEVLWVLNVFISINETRRLEHEAGGNSSALNSVIAEFIDNGFVLSIASGIRKLWEQSNTNRNKQIVSLLRVIDDVKKNAHLITRENYVCYDGLPYDYQAVRSNWEKRNLGQSDISGKVFRLDTSGPNAFGMSALLHKSFDRISFQDSNNSKHSRTDQIDPRILERLIAHVKEAEISEIKTLADKLLLHAGDRVSRELASKAPAILTINKLKRCVKALYEASAFLGSTVLGRSHPGGFQIAQYNVFEKLEHPWCAKEHKNKISEVWDEFTTEVSHWDASKEFENHT